MLRSTSVLQWPRRAVSRYLVAVPALPGVTGVCGQAPAQRCRRPAACSAALCTPSRCYASAPGVGGGSNNGGDSGTNSADTSTSGAGGKGRLDSDQTDSFASQHFDLQDVDADRLTHFFWDRNEEGGSPYMMSDAMLNELDEVLLMSEDNFENAWFVDPRDRRLLFNEYLYV